MPDPTPTTSEIQAVNVAVQKSEWQWFGASGHLCVGQWCRFHLTTQVGKYLVSTVGAYVHPRHSNGNEKAESEWLQKNWPGEQIGLGRTFETMVFEAGAPCVDEKCGCGMPSIGGSELDSEGYNVAKDATGGHMRMCEKWSAISTNPPSPKHF